jgi:proteasome accessory factor B
MNRIERLINLVAALLETSHPMTADDIREKIAGYDQETDQAFRRALERDKQELRDMGIPIETVATDPFDSTPDGYVIDKGSYYLQTPDLAPDELAALKIAADAVLGGDDAAAGFMKLSMSTPVAPWGGPRMIVAADVSAEQPVLGPLYAALIARKRVRFDYTNAAGESSRRNLEIYGLVHRKGRWYAVGGDADRSAVRSFKISRISSRVTQLDDSYAIPEGFDAAAHLPREAWDLDAGETGPATLRFTASMRWWAEQNMSELERAEGPDGALDIVMPVANIEALLGFVISFSGDVEIVAPPEARSRLLEHLATFIEAQR